jgi:hypothetical protein
LIVTFFSGICLEQNLGPDRARITKKIDASLFKAKRINHCNDFVARVALEVVDSAWWKQQLRVKSAGQQSNSLVIDKGGPAAIICLRVVSVRVGFPRRSV